nr:MAG TPA: hypothetical protein [Bacteriophage sp.]
MLPKFVLLKYQVLYLSIFPFYQILSVIILLIQYYF